jgi:hypothetical protein
MIFILLRLVNAETETEGGADAHGRENTHRWGTLRLPSLLLLPRQQLFKEALQVEGDAEHSDFWFDKLVEQTNPASSSLCFGCTKPSSLSLRVNNYAALVSLVRNSYAGRLVDILDVKVA